VVSGSRSSSSAQVTALDLPGAPNKPAVATNGNLTMLVSWSGPTPTVAAPVNSYRVSMSVDNGPFSPVASGSCTSPTPPATTCTRSPHTTANPCTVTGLVAGTTYYFKVSGVISGVEGPMSAASGPATAIDVPLAPAMPALAVDGDRSMSVTWSPVTSTAARPV